MEVVCLLVHCGPVKVSTPRPGHGPRSLMRRRIYCKKMNDTSISRDDPTLDGKGGHVNLVGGSLCGQVVGHTACREGDYIA